MKTGLTREQSRLNNFIFETVRNDHILVLIQDISLSAGLDMIKVSAGVRAPEELHGPVALISLNKDLPHKKI